MKALVYTGTHEIVYRDEPAPEIAPAANDALVRVDAVGICGSDMHAYHGHDPRRVPPLILGHEAVGEALSGEFAGRRVAVNPLITCGVCDDCVGGRANLCRRRELISMNRPGAFAEQVAIPAQNLIPLPDNISTVNAALTEPAATALHAVHLAVKASVRPLAETRALVLGGGSIGLLAALILRWQGCRDITLAETNPLRRQSAAATGACETHDPINQAALPENTYQLVIDAVGSPPTRQAGINAVAPGGVIIHTGLQQNGGEFDVRKLTLSEVTFIGTYTYTAVDLRAALAALASGALGDLAWVEQRPLSDGAAAFADIDRGRTAAAKIVLIT